MAECRQGKRDARGVDPKVPPQVLGNVGSVWAGTSRPTLIG
jgi:hypothetical protein